MDTHQLKKEFTAALEATSTREQVEVVERTFLGRGDGKLTALLRGLKDLPEAERKVVGPKLQALKTEFEGAVAEKRRSLTSGARGETSETADSMDLTLPPAASPVGHQHPLTAFLDRCVDVFSSMGFEVVEGPEVETAEYNFTKLNMGEDHPARDLWDTFYVEESGIWNLESGIWNQGSKIRGRRSNVNGPADAKALAGRQMSNVVDRLLLRTHTSPVQLRSMETRKPPVRIIVPGRVFRHEATDAGHETTFCQLEGFAIDKHVRVTDLIGTLKSFLAAIFGNVQTRVRPHYYPFVEPGMDMDMRCLICSGRGCSVCKRSGWLEMLGSGMIHPNVLANMKVDSKIWNGFAFGLGIDRFMMLYHRINDVRLSYSGDVRFVRQF